MLTSVLIMVAEFNGTYAVMDHDAPCADIAEYQTIAADGMELYSCHVVDALTLPADTVYVEGYGIAHLNCETIQPITPDCQRAADAWNVKWGKN